MFLIKAMADNYLATAKDLMNDAAIILMSAAMNEIDGSNAITMWRQCHHLPADIVKRKKTLDSEAVSLASLAKCLGALSDLKRHVDSYASSHVGPKDGGGMSRCFQAYTLKGPLLPAPQVAPQRVAPQLIEAIR